MSIIKEYTDVTPPLIGEFFTWVKRWVPAAPGQHLAAAALSCWVGDAIYGQGTIYGPYRALYGQAEWQLRQYCRLGAGDVPFGIWRTIPDPGWDGVDTIAQLYSAIYVTADMMNLGREDIDLVTKVVGRSGITTDRSWVLPRLDPDVPRFTDLLDRVDAVWEEHATRCDGGCSVPDRFYPSERARSATWYERFAPERRDAFNGF